MGKQLDDNQGMGDGLNALSLIVRANASAFPAGLCGSPVPRQTAIRVGVQHNAAFESGHVAV
jgi:hypothetical protein